MIGVIARVPTKRSHNNSKTVSENGHHDADLEFSPASTPHIPHDSAYTDDEMLRLVLKFLFAHKKFREIAQKIVKFL